MRKFPSHIQLHTNLEQARLANLEYAQQFITRPVIQNLIEFINLTNPITSKEPLIRLGGNHDGGYVVSDCFTKKFAISLGVGVEVSADIDLLDKGFSILAVDGTVSNPLPKESRYIFTGKNIGYNRESDKEISLRELLEEVYPQESPDLLLIDVEGHEYSILENELKIVISAKQIVIEFHGLEFLGDQEFANRVNCLLRSLRRTHKPIHIHANNSGGGINLGGVIWPTILEITFLANEFCENVRNIGPFPTALDFPNTNARPDMDLNPFYGESPQFGKIARAVLGI
jgi:hypothetical protein